MYGKTIKNHQKIYGEHRPGNDTALIPCCQQRVVKKQDYLQNGAGEG